MRSVDRIRTGGVHALTGLPDERLTRVMPRVTVSCSVAVGLVGSAILAGWLHPAVAAALPEAGGSLTASAALALILLAVAAVMTLPSFARWVRWTGAVLALVTIPLAGVAVLGPLADPLPHLEHLLPGHSLFDVRQLSAPTAAWVVLFAVAAPLALSRSIAARRIVSGLTAILAIGVIFLFSAHLFGASGLLGLSESALNTLLATICMGVLLVGWSARLIADGYWPIMIRSSISGRDIRLATPLAVLVPIGVLWIAYALQREAVLPGNWAAALGAVALITAMVGIAVLSAARIDALEAQIRQASLTDDMTRLWNLRGLRLLGQQLLAAADRERRPVTVAVFDIDGLKQVNDSFGHAAGSDLLVDFATALARSFRKTDLVSRLGGDEFVVLVSGDERAADRGLERLRRAVERVRQSGDRPYRLAYSTGVLIRPPGDARSFGDLLAEADLRMYAEKAARAGRQADGAIRLPR